MLPGGDGSGGDQQGNIPFDIGTYSILPTTENHPGDGVESRAGGKRLEEWRLLATFQ
jgi:hypothetical protein